MKKDINELRKMQSCIGCKNEHYLPKKKKDIPAECLNCEEITINTNYDDDKPDLKDEIISLVSELRIAEKELIELFSEDEITELSDKINEIEAEIDKKIIELME